MQGVLHLVDAEAEAAPAAPPKHIVFVDDASEVRQFDPVKHFDTVPELLDRPANRLRRRQLQETTIAATADVKVRTKGQGGQETKGLRRASDEMESTRGARRARDERARRASDEMESTRGARALTVDFCFVRSQAVDKQRERAYTELAARMDRVEKLHDAAEELNLQRQLMVMRAPHLQRAAPQTLIDKGGRTHGRRARAGGARSARTRAACQCTSGRRSAKSSAGAWGRVPSSLCFSL